ncbi:MAG: hypothetical protein JKY96_06470, partial [Phycisphaerales bacterium]|nr:hypothetical protein [Phycisphaerales bacterium]
MSMIPGNGIWLLAAADEREADAVLAAFGHAPSGTSLWSIVQVNDRFDLVRTGVGKANAAGAIGRVLDPDRHAGVISVGIGGALPDGG